MEYSRFELLQMACKATMLPLSLIPQQSFFSLVSRRCLNGYGIILRIIHQIIFLPIIIRGWIFLLTWNPYHRSFPPIFFDGFLHSESTPFADSFSSLRVSVPIVDFQVFFPRDCRPTDVFQFWYHPVAKVKLYWR